MKPAPFRYCAPTSLKEVTETLAAYGDEAKLIAGGQSLGPMLNLRLASPEVLVDLNRVTDLERGAHREAEGIVIGALTRQRDAERDETVASDCPLLVEALHHVAHPAIRNRGTVGGSVAHADPAAELPAVVLALDASLTAVSVRGVRELSAAEFFGGYFTTALAADEVLVAIRIPGLQARTGCAWHEFATRHGDFAVVGVAAVITLDDDGAATGAAVAYAGVGDTPRLLAAAGEVLAGPQPERRIQDSAELAASLVDPPSDLVASARYRRRLVRALTRRALVDALARARGRS